MSMLDSLGAGTTATGGGLNYDGILSEILLGGVIVAIYVVGVLVDRNDRTV